MEAALKTNQSFEELVREMNELGRKARFASRRLAIASTEQKNEALIAMAKEIQDHADDLLSANEKDVAAAIDKGRPEAFIDRLKLNPERIAAMTKGLREIADLEDPVGEIIAEWERPNGLRIQRKRVPLGVIGIIYESRPNVTADAGGLCLKSGNSVILRGGSESHHTSKAIHACLIKGLRSAGLPEDSIQIVPSTDRDAVGLLLKGLDGNIDVIVPRGGKSLVARVQEEARVPVFAHLEGICHVYVHEDADLSMAVNITVNAKMRRSGICGAAETLLIDQPCVSTHLKPIVEALMDAGCEVRGDALVQSEVPQVKAASEEDWSTEYLEPIISIRAVEDVEEAVRHIANYGSQHTDSIVTENMQAAEIFLNEVDSAIVLHNASTQFADGGEFGMGAEIGIATGKMHARGPVGVEQLTSFKYVIRGSGQTRPQ